MTGRAYMGEALVQVWLTSPQKRCAMKMKKETRKNDVRVKMFLMEGSSL